MSARNLSPTEKPLFSRRSLIVLVLLGVIGLGGYVLQSGSDSYWDPAPEIRPTIESRSSIGFAAWAQLLRLQKLPVATSRSRPFNEQQKLEVPETPDSDEDGAGDSDATQTVMLPATPLPVRYGLLILTPHAGIKPDRLRAAEIATRTLIALPKWEANPAPGKPHSVVRINLSDPDMTARLIGAHTDEEGQLRPIGAIERTDLKQPVALFHYDAGKAHYWGSLSAEARVIQTVRYPGLVPILITAKGKTVLGRLPDGRYVLSDPDLVSAPALRTPGGAVQATRLLSLVRYPAETRIAFDLWLHYGEKHPNLYSLLVQPPGLGAFVLGVITLGLFGWMGLARFGPARTLPPPYSFGPAMLIENATILINQAGKAPELTRRYGLTLRDQVIQTFATRQDRLDHLDPDALIERLENRAGITIRFADLMARLTTTPSPSVALDVARRLSHWKSEITREHR